jgi:outer membrane protein
MKSVSRTPLVNSRNRIMRTHTLQRAAMSFVLAGGAVLPFASSAEDAPWLVRMRAVDLESARKDSTGLDLSINNELIPEIDFSRFFTPEIAVELVLTCPQKQTIRSGGVGIGRRL